IFGIVARETFGVSVSAKSIRAFRDCPPGRHGLQTTASLPQCRTPRAPVRVLDEYSDSGNGRWSQFSVWPPPLSVDSADRARGGRLDWVLALLRAAPI